MPRPDPRLLIATVATLGALGCGGGTLSSPEGQGGSAGGQATGGRPQGAGGSAGQSACLDASGHILPELKRCATDADCEFVATYSCCGPGPIIGLAKTAESMIPGCFTTSYPQNCPPLGCASQATTEDGQPAGTGDLSSVVARCLEVASAEKACMTTVRGSCVHNVTRCAAGETCSNECNQACSCQNGYQVCARPTNGAACSEPPVYCAYLTAPGGSVSTICSCTATSPTWACGA